MSKLANTSHVNSWLSTSNTNEIIRVPKDRSFTIDEILFASDKYDVGEFILNHLKPRLYKEYDEIYLMKFIEEIVEFYDNDKLWHAISQCKLNDDILNKYTDKLIKYPTTFSLTNNRSYSYDTMVNIIWKIDNLHYNDKKYVIENIFKYQIKLPMVYFDVFQSYKEFISISPALQHKYYLYHYDCFDHKLVAKHHPSFTK